MTAGAEKAFYDRQFHRQSPEVVDVAAAQATLRARGDRYFCVTDYLTHSESLDAVEWGFGGVSRLLAMQSLFRSYTALDLSAGLWLRGQSVAANVRDCDLNADLPFAAESFDVSIAMMVIEHLFDPFHSFREIARTTKLKGVVFVNLPLVTGIRNRARVLFGEVPITSARDWWSHREWDGGHLHYFSIDSVRRLGELNGLRLERVYPIGSHQLLKKLAPQLFSGELSFVFRKYERSPSP